MEVSLKDTQRLYNKLRRREWVKKNLEANREHSRKFKREHPEYAKNYRLLNPQKDKAHHNASRDLRIGSVCSKCGSTENLERHHPDYSKPNLVETVCRMCHQEIHGRLLK